MGKRMAAHRRVLTLGSCLAALVTQRSVESFSLPAGRLSAPIYRRNKLAQSTTENADAEPTTSTEPWSLPAFTPVFAESLSYAEDLAKIFVSANIDSSLAELRTYVQIVTVIRVAVPATLAAVASCLVYPSASLTLAAMINDSDAFSVISQDSSQYIQNILTTCGLMFVLLTGNTYYFLYSQQEKIYHAFFDEVTVAKSLLEQVALVCQGRKTMYLTLLSCIDKYVREDLMRFDVEPSVLLSSRPADDPLEDIMYMTSVGEPSVVYQTVRTLRQARAARLGAIQRKLPQIHMVLLWSLAAIVLSTFPLLGAGSQVIGGFGILQVQAVYLSFIVFGIGLVMGVLEELQRPGGKGAYNVATVLTVMVQGLEDELEGRMFDKYVSRLPPSGIVETIYSNSEPVDVATLRDEEDDRDVSDDEQVDDKETGFVRRIANRIRNRRNEPT